MLFPSNDSATNYVIANLFMGLFLRTECEVIIILSVAGDILGWILGSYISPTLCETSIIGAVLGIEW